MGYGFQGQGQISMKNLSSKGSDLFGNQHERRHSSLGNITPAEFERRWRAGVNPEENRLEFVRHRVTHRRPVPGSSQATEPAVRG